MDRKVMPIGKGPDGGWGWMVVLATGTGDAIISTFAFVMSPIFIELRRYFNATAEETSWFLSLQCISFALAFIGTSSSDRIGARNTVIIFGSLATLGIFISQFAWNIYYLYVSIGVITGLGFSGSLSPLHVMTARYFPQRYPLATGIAMVGPGLWLFISPPIVQACVDRYGWRGAFLIESAIIGNLLVCGAILRPLRSVKNTQENTFCKRGQRPITDALENGECRDSEKSEDCTPEKTKSGNSYLADCFALYREPRFMTFVVSRFLLGCAYSGAMLHLQPRANVAMVGTSQQTAFLVSISGICSVIGRVVGSSVIVHFKLLSAMNTYILSVSIFGVACLIPQLADTYIGFSILSGILGMCSGTYFSVSLVCARELVGLQKVSFGIAMVFFSLGTGMVIGPPIAGRIYDTWGSYDYAYCVLGTLSLLSGAALVPWQIRSKFKDKL